MKHSANITFDSSIVFGKNLHLKHLMTQSSHNNIKIFKFSKIYKIFINLFQTMYNVFQCNFCVTITAYIYLLVLTLKTHQNCALCKCKTLIVGFFWFFLYFRNNLYDCGYFSANLCTYCVCYMLIKCILNLHQNMHWIIFHDRVKIMKNAIFCDICCQL